MEAQLQSPLPLSRSQSCAVLPCFRKNEFVKLKLHVYAGTARVYNNTHQSQNISQNSVLHEHWSDKLA